MPSDLLTHALYIGLMSGTSMDGVDGVLGSFDAQDGAHTAQVIAHAHVDFAPSLRAMLAALQNSDADEIHREAMAANLLTQCYADCVAQLLAASGTSATSIRAIGAHGQTVRHRPDLGYSRQINNPALLAELSAIDVVADFRSRDIAAGGQGAPLVPAFHQWLFGAASTQRVLANIGGISNISVVAASNDSTRPTTGFDTGPGNVLLDYWIAQQRGVAYDAGGAWGASGVVHAGLLAALRDEPFFKLSGPKSTGRDLFNAAWLQHCLAPFGTLDVADIQATLTELTATTLAAAIHAHAPSATQVYVCGGGAFNSFLMTRLQAALTLYGSAASLHSTASLGVPPDQVEALAFAWLARQFTLRESASIAAVTGARGARILGALYPS